MDSTSPAAKLTPQLNFAVEVPVEYGPDALYPPVPPKVASMIESTLEELSPKN